MSAIFPIPRQSREAILTAAGGQTAFGPFDFPIFDAHDVQVRIKAPGDDDYTLLSSADFTIAPAAPAVSFPALFTLTLDDAATSGTLVWVRGARVPYRLLNATQGGAINSLELEKELDRTSLTLQELRRDIDAILSGDVPAGALASAVLNNSAAPGGTVADALEGLETRIDGNADDIADLRTDLGAVQAAVTTYGTVAAAQAAIVGVSVNFLRTAGYTTVGDGGGAMYKRAGSEPAHNGKLQSADGAWWELAELQPDIKMFGARCNGVTNDLTAIRNGIAYCGLKGRSKLTAQGGGISVVDGTITIAIDNFHFAAAGRAQFLIVQRTLNIKTIVNSGLNNNLSGFGVIYNDNALGVAASGGDAIYSDASGLRISDVWADNAWRGFVFVSGQVLGNMLTATSCVQNGLATNACLDLNLSDCYINAGTEDRGLLGNLRLVDQSEAIQLANVVCLTGKYGMTTASTLDTYGTRPAWGAFVNLIIDGSLLGSTIEDMMAITWSGCWFSGGSRLTGGPAHGVEFINCKNNVFLGLRLINCGKAGGYVRNSCTEMHFVHPIADSNSVRSASGAYPGILFEAGTSRFSVMLPAGANDTTPGGQQGYSVTVEVGASDYYTIIANGPGGTLGVVSDGGTGVNKTVIVDGLITARKINGLTVTASTGTLTVPNGVTMTGPAASGTVMTLGNAETVTGAKTFGAAGAVGKLKLAGNTSGSTTLDASATASGTLTLPAATDTLVGKATTDVLTNKTFDTAGTGNVFKINGTTISDKTGTGKAVLDTSPQLTTPDIGAATGTSATLTGDAKAANFRPYDNTASGSMAVGFSSAGPSFYLWGNSAAGAGAFEMYSGGVKKAQINGGAGGVFEFLLDRGVKLSSQTSAAAAATGTLTNAPAAGNPGFWLKININGTNYAIPAWAG